MRLLVTGVEGYIGCLLAPFLQERGHDVLGIDTGYYREGWLFSDRCLVPGFPRTANRDIRQLEIDDLVGFEAVVHLAELPASPLQDALPGLTFDVNHHAAVRLASLARSASVERFVYASSCNVYGADAGSRTQSERSPVDPHSPHAACNVLVERDVAAMASAGFSPTFLRKATPYGPSPRMRFDTLLNQACGSAAATGTVTIAGSETTWRPFVHVLDFCEAVACTLEAPRDAVHGEVFNVGQQADNLQLRDVGILLKGLYPDCDLAFSKSSDHDSRRVSFSKFRDHVPQFRCCWDVPRGMRQLQDLFARIRLDPATFQARQFTRSKQLSYLNETGLVDSQFFWMH